MGLLESIGRVMPGVGFLLGGVIAQLLNPRASFVTAGIGALTVLGRGGAAAAAGRLATGDPSPPCPPRQVGDPSSELR